MVLIFAVLNICYFDTFVEMIALDNFIATKTLDAKALTKSDKNLGC